MSSDPLATLLGLQRADGAFGSIIVGADGHRTPDANGFTTAVVLRHLRHVPVSPRLAVLMERALDWLEACRSSRVPGAFAFWPEAARPAWARAVPADVDDTAIMLLELLRHGRLDRAAALRAVCTAILPCQVSATDLAVLPPWVAQGSFYTWIPDPAPEGAWGLHAANIVDCCVNANVAALLARLGLSDFPGQEAAARTVIAGLRWAGTEERRLGALTPFYPSAASLAEAVTHAVECGAAALIEAQGLLRAAPERLAGGSPGLCRGAYGHQVWHARAVDIARTASA